MNGKTEKIAVAVVEDDTGLRSTLRRSLDESPDACCIVAVCSAEEAFEKLPGLNPDVVLMDVNLPGASGVQCVERLAPLLPGTNFIMLTVFDDTEVVFQSLAAGAIGYLTKPVTEERLLEAIRDVYAGGAPMTSSIARRIVQAFRKPPEDPRLAVEEILAPREQEVLRLLAKGYLQKEIADQLDISFPTVRTLTARIYTKLHVHSRSQAVAKYLGEEG
jgi:DNA-binding NarL/FixJ family response regulator